MSIWDPERARKRKLQLDQQKLARELDAADEQQARLTGAAKTTWIAAGLMNFSAVMSVFIHSEHLGFYISIGAGALFSAAYMADLAGSWAPPRWGRWAINAYGVAAAVVLVWQMTKHGGF